MDHATAHHKPKAKARLPLLLLDDAITRRAASRRGDSFIAGGHGLELSPACAEPATEGEEELRRPRWWRRQHLTMGALYAELTALLPGLRYRAGREEIMEVVAEHVKVLEDTVAVLEAYRTVQAGGGGAAEEVSVSYRETVCFAARLPAARWRRPGALTRLLEAFDRRGVEVLAATLARAGGGEEGATMVTVTVAAAAPDIASIE